MDSRHFSFSFFINLYETVFVYNAVTYIVPYESYMQAIACLMNYFIDSNKLTYLSGVDAFFVRENNCSYINCFIIC